MTTTIGCRKIAIDFYGDAMSLSHRTRISALSIFLTLSVSACAKKDIQTTAHATGSAQKPSSSRVVQDRTAAADQRTILILGGKFCDFYYKDVEAALKDVPGVRDVDFKTMKGHAIVTFESGNVNPVDLLSAVRTVKGDGYYCKATVKNE
jgi:copper chaperone CopZ